MVNILELSIIKAIAPFEICISGGGCALAALNLGAVSIAHQISLMLTYLLVCDTMRHKATLKTDTSGLKLVGTTCVFSIDQAHELRGAVAVVVWWAVC